ncbi:MAG TPA: ATP-binding protein [Steroidobacteraceae bacterium]|nr:ATP-binding protein [Steroidobacteraceae bacterium]
MAEYPEQMQATRAGLVGRQRELGRLRARLDTTAAGKGGIVLVGGEPGIGKTRLLTEMAEEARAAGWRVLWGRAYDGEGMPAYLPFAEALREYVRACPLDPLEEQLGDGAADVALIVPDLQRRVQALAPSPALSPEHERYRFFESVSDFLLNVAGVGTAGVGGRGPNGPASGESGVGADFDVDREAEAVTTAAAADQCQEGPGDAARPTPDTQPGSSARP